MVVQSINRSNSDTIAAIATAPGIGGIGIIRISGPQALPVIQQLFCPHRSHKIFQSHKLYYGTIIDQNRTVLDEVLAVYMSAPHTYTREDIVEIHSHGSYLVQQAILRAVFCSGVRPAEPGEFTKRAFLGGRLDLTQAEGVIDLLQAQTETGARLAVSQLQGRLYERIEQIRQALVTILAIIEVAIDFPEDDVEILDKDNLLFRLREEVDTPLQALIALAKQGKIFREGVKVVIAGRPNVGKSSLLNALLQEDRALVTSIPGTTRDTIEEIISVKGIPVYLVDTAGIRDDADQVEELGIERARKKIHEADLVIFLVDGTEELTVFDRQLYESVRQKKRIVVINKLDTADAGNVKKLAIEFNQDEVVIISARESLGIDSLQEAIFRKILGEETLHEQGACAPNVRHRAILEKALGASNRVQKALRADFSADLLAIEVQSVLDHLGDIVGLTTPDDILDKIFSDFCIGK